MPCFIATVVADGLGASIFNSIFSSIGGGGGGGGFLSALLPFALAPFGFESGGIVPSAAAGMITPSGSGGMPAILHPREMVLPARISEGVQRMVASGSGRSEGSGSESNGGAAAAEAGDFHLHYAPSSSAIDARGMHQLFKEHAKTISDVVIDHLNRRGGRYPKFGAG